jgi:hypothetical protein
LIAVDPVLAQVDPVFAHVDPVLATVGAVFAAGAAADDPVFVQAQQAEGTVAVFGATDPVFATLVPVFTATDPVFATVGPTVFATELTPAVFCGATVDGGAVHVLATVSRVYPILQAWHTWLFE